MKFQFSFSSQQLSNGRVKFQFSFSFSSQQLSNGSQVQFLFLFSSQQLSNGRIKSVLFQFSFSFSSRQPNLNFGRMGRPSQLGQLGRLKTKSKGKREKQVCRPGPSVPGRLARLAQLRFGPKKYAVEVLVKMRLPCSMTASSQLFFGP